MPCKFLFFTRIRLVHVFPQHCTFDNLVILLRSNLPLQQRQQYFRDMLCHLLILDPSIQIFNVHYNLLQGAFPQNLDHRFEQCSLHFLNLFFFFSFTLFQRYHAILTIILFLNLNISHLLWFGSTLMFLYLIIAVITRKWTQTTLVPAILQLAPKFAKNPDVRIHSFTKSL